MNYFRSLAIGTTLMVSLSLPAPLAAAAHLHGEDQDQSQNTAPVAMPTVEQHLKALSEKLDLTAGQQAKIRPILQRMQADWQTIMRDNTLSEQARHDKMKSVRDKAERQARPLLTKEQKKKLDELDQEPHPGDGNGAATPPPQ